NRENSKYRHSGAASGETGSDNRRKNSVFVKPANAVRVKAGIDRPMLVIVVLLLCFGSIMVFSASFAYALSKHGDSYFYIKKQLVFVGVGIVIMLIASTIDYRVMRRFVLPFFFAMLVVQILVPIYGMAAGVAKRWVQIGGFRFQPSELMKTALIMFLAHYIATYQDKITDYKDFKTSSIWGDLIPSGIILFVCAEMALQSHLSGMIIMFLIGIVVLFAGGARKFWFFAAGGVLAVGGGVFLLVSSYAAKRIQMWLHPENFSLLDDTWQSVQGVYAIGSGGLWGVGLGNSIQKYSYVSEPQNDFIFSIICEELGFIGAIAVIALFIPFTWRGIVIAMRAPDTFSSLTVLGIVFKVTLQAILNIGVVSGLLPNTGITLPFFSYGGTALMVLLGEMGIVLSISRYSLQEK
ncbi:MAG: cell division protein FtsW, partial [Clostridia bacterium]|nr:cell division protein FtsW [Clostridia bacterium]